MGRAKPQRARSSRAICRNIVRPGKASMFGRSQSYRERNQIPVSMKRLFVVNKRSAFFSFFLASSPSRRRSKPRGLGEGSMGDRTLVGTKAHSGGEVAVVPPRNSIRYKIERIESSARLDSRFNPRLWLGFQALCDRFN